MTNWIGPIGNCDACQRDLKEEEFFYDARTKVNSPGMGRWGIFCPRCFNDWCSGLGTGLGQKFRTSDGLKMEG